jgi:hypothetical protein
LYWIPAAAAHTHTSYIYASSKTKCLCKSWSVSSRRFPDIDSSSCERISTKVRETEVEEINEYERGGGSREEEGEEEEEERGGSREEG